DPPTRAVTVPSMVRRFMRFCIQFSRRKSNRYAYNLRVPRRRSDDSQTLRALLEMRELLVRGEFRAGERIREIPLAARLRVSRTPLRTVLGRLEQEGLVAARPTGGYLAAGVFLPHTPDRIEGPRRARRP